MVQSISLFNEDAIPLYLSVPLTDKEAFLEALQPFPCHILTDEEILAQSCKEYGPLPRVFPCHLLQQLVKLEFWRMNYCENYIWLDSDSYFIKSFRREDFFPHGTIPYTIQHQGEELLGFAKRANRAKIEKDLRAMTGRIQKAFGREGEFFDFGYAPLIWSSAVLRSLSNDFLLPRQKSIYELLMEYPCEMQLYGEYLLVSKKIPLVPMAPLFKCYHYAEQFYEDQEQGVSEHGLAQQYFGVVMQSNWARVPREKKNDLVRFKKFVKSLIQATERKLRFGW